MLKNIIGAVAAGVMISVGGTAFLSCSNKYVGAILFSVALLCICYRNYYLFTGKVGFVLKKHTKRDVYILCLGLMVNLATTLVMGCMLRYSNPGLNKIALDMCVFKLAQTVTQALIRSIFCGILMYIAVTIYRTKENIVGILFCVPIFILSGFEHSIADMFYFSVSGLNSWNVIFYLCIVIFGNSLGGMASYLIDGYINNDLNLFFNSKKIKKTFFQE